jgi:malate/lactate dehydrogenase
MEFGVREVVQFGAILVSISGAWAAARSAIKQLTEKMVNHEQRILKMDHRLDEAESARAVIGSKIEILSTISSVEALEKHNREVAKLEATVEMLTREVDLIRNQHNHRHPYTPPPDQS